MIPAALQKFVDDSIAAPDTLHVRSVYSPVNVGTNWKTIVVHGAGGAGVVFDRTFSATLKVETIIVLPGGTLEMRPASPDVKHEIVFRDTPFDDVLDPGHFGHGLICLGKCLIAGSPKASYARALRMPGTNFLPLERPASWRDWDKLVFPDTRQLAVNDRAANYTPKWEVVELGTGDSLRTPLTMASHSGRVTPDGVAYHPHIGNLTRNVVIRSENDHGNRGSVSFRDLAEVDVTNCEFESLGRTRIGGVDNWRYPVQFLGLRTHAKFNNNSIWCALHPADCRFRWGLVIHDTHWSEFKGNVVHNWSGAGIALTNGNETGNLVAENLITGTRGYDNPRNNNGDDGSGIWSVGWLSLFFGNIVAGCGSYFSGIVAGCGYNLFSRTASTHDTGMVVNSPDYDFVVWRARDMRQTPLAGFDENEAYGCACGLTIWNLGSDGYKTFPITQSVVRGFVAWNCWEEAFFAYPIHKVLFEGCEAIYCGNGWDSGDYWASDCTLHRCTMVGCGNGTMGLNNSGTFLVDDCDFQVNGTGVLVQTRATPGTIAYCPPRTTRVVNCRHKPMPGMTLTTIRASYWIGHGNTQLFQMNAIEVISHNGVVGDDFAVYYPESAAAFAIPTHSAPTWQTPQPAIVAGLTNSQAMAQAGVAIAGVIAPSNTTRRLGVGGLIALKNVPVPPVNKPPVVDAGPDQTILWDMRGAIQLAGTVEDLDSPAVLTVGWSQLSGPGGAAFSNVASPTSRVLLTAAGEYTLRLLASDGELTASDAVTVVVLPEPVPEPETVAVPAAELAVVRGALQAVLAKMEGWGL